MKNISLLLLFVIGLLSNVCAQYKKDGSPDMRYSINKQNYGSAYSPQINQSGTNSELRYQSGYTRSNGTYVEPHYKTANNDTNHDNFSTQGNYNPYNNTNGSRAKDYSSDAYNYGSGKTIHTGPRGGQYYINSNGNKTYVPKRNGVY